MFEVRIGNDKMFVTDLITFVSGYYFPYEAVKGTLSYTQWENQVKAIVADLDKTIQYYLVDNDNDWFEWNYDKEKGYVTVQFGNA